MATFLGVDESYIWPDVLGGDEVAGVYESEAVAVWPHRSEVPRDVWGHLFSAAEREIGVLVYAGLFLSEDAGIQKILKDKAAAGAGADPARQPALLDSRPIGLIRFIAMGAVVHDAPRLVL